MFITASVLILNPCIINAVEDIGGILLAAAALSALPLGLLIYQWPAYLEYRRGGPTHTRREAKAFARIVKHACATGSELRIRFMGEKLAVPAVLVRRKLRRLHTKYCKALGGVPARARHDMYTPALHDVVLLDEKAHDFATSYSEVSRTLKTAGWALLAGAYLLIGAFIAWAYGQEPHHAWAFTGVAIAWATLLLWMFPVCSPVVLVFVAWLALTLPLGPLDYLLDAYPAPYQGLSTIPLALMLLWMTPLFLVLLYAAWRVHEMLKKEAELREDFLAWLYRMLPGYRVPRGQG